jgi:hypothetical protein
MSESGAKTKDAKFDYAPYLGRIGGKGQLAGRQVVLYLTDDGQSLKIALFTRGLDAPPICDFVGSLIAEGHVEREDLDALKLCTSVPGGYFDGLLLRWRRQ